MISNRILQKLQQKLSPQQIQLMKLLQVPTFALEQRIKDEIEKNPTLEEDESSEKTENEDNQENAQDEDAGADNDVFGDMEMFPNDDDIITFKNNDNYEKLDRNQIFVSETTFHEDLISQLQLKPISEKQILIGLELIGNIDDSGYLSRSIPSDRKSVV